MISTLLTVLWMLGGVVGLAAVAMLIVDMIGRPRRLVCTCQYRGVRTYRHLRTGGTAVIAVGYGGFAVAQLTHIDGRVSILFGVAAAVVAVLIAWDTYWHHTRARAMEVTPR